MNGKTNKLENYDTQLYYYGDMKQTRDFKKTICTFVLQKFDQAIWGRIGAINIQFNFPEVKRHDWDEFNVFSLYYDNQVVFLIDLPSTSSERTRAMRKII
jgi:hypothetical protein